MSARLSRPPGLAAERRATLEHRFGPWRSMTVAGALDRAAERYGDAPFVVGDDVSLSYREVRDRSRRIAAGLTALGVAPGDHVALVMANHPDFPAIKFAIARTGAVSVPVNHLYRARELGYVLRQSDAKLLITMDHFRDLDHAAALDELAPGWETGGGGDRLAKLQRVVVFDPQGETRPGATRLDALESLADARCSATRWRSRPATG